MPPKTKPASSIAEIEEANAANIAKYGFPVEFRINVFCSGPKKESKEVSFFDYADVIIDGRLVSEGAPEETQIDDDSSAYVLVATYETRAAAEFIKKPLRGNMVKFEPRVFDVVVKYYYKGHEVTETQSSLKLPGSIPYDTGLILESEIRPGLSETMALKKAIKTYGV